ncbi:hypothetical protein BASA50_006491 [Batrachochytrium salamandrivorans]|uniref:Impact N-terminal domain-containing protein n=1 Tax=Batrachochytrium salamandrivorans TaxID=1357716 RepID=A0ABQ8F9K5_9FUNG|nr:hypothetical protein BASA50_006491 [Batrachochytrium salamandrivorans]KAJ1340012.1 hypothetical protein BSLG_005336 [Batrachochytrium salamandrivorans]
MVDTPSLIQLSSLAVDEIETLTAIYGIPEALLLGSETDDTTTATMHDDDDGIVMTIETPSSIKFRLGSRRGCLVLHLHCDYPLLSPPIYILHLPAFCSPYPVTVPVSVSVPVSVPVSDSQNVWVDEESFRSWIDMQLMSLFTPGHVVIYSWVDFLQEIIGQVYRRSNCTDLHVSADPASALLHAADTTGMSDVADPPLLEPSSLQQSTLPGTTPAATPLAILSTGSAYPLIYPSGCPEIHTSLHPLVDRKSEFIAHVAQISSIDQVHLVKQALLSNKRIARATHNIIAYRIVEPVTNRVKQDSDDDGEDAAGARLLHLLNLTEARNVCVVVTRWYGGIQLGPARFKHINNVARLLLTELGLTKRR